MVSRIRMFVWSFVAPSLGMPRRNLGTVMKFFRVTAEKVKNALPCPKHAFPKMHFQIAFPELGTPLDDSTLYPGLVFLN